MFFTFGMMTQRTASWEIWHLERGFELFEDLWTRIGGEPKSVKRLRSGDLLIETTSALQTKSFLLAKSFLNSPVTVFPHKSLNSCRGVISEPDLLGTSDSEILEGFSGQGVTQVRRITIKKDSTIIPTKHLILTFTSPTLPQTIKAGYLNCKIRPYIPNPLRCFQCQRFGHSQTACRGQLTCSRCASVGHASSDCTLEQKCVNCSQPHSADSKLCPKWKIEKEIQTIKTNRNISYIEARKFITPQPSQTYAQVAKSMTVNNSSQTDETITKIVCPPLKLLQPLITISKPIMSPSIPEVIKSSTSTQAELVPSTSSVTVASPSQSPPPNSVIDTTPTTSNSLSISAASSSSQSVIPPPSDSYKVQDAKKLAKARSRKRKKELLKKMKEAIVDIKMNPHRPKKPASDESTSDEEEMIVYDVEDEIESNPDYEKKGVLGILCSRSSRVEEIVRLGILCSRSSRVEEIVGLGIPLRSLWPTLHCRRVAGVSPLLSIGWWYLSSVSPKRHCCRVSAADKGCRVYPLDPRRDAVAPHSTLNFSRGVISPADFLDVSTEEIKENMQARNVCDVRRITIRRDGQVLNTKHLILTFNTPDLPQTVKMAYIRCPVRPYIPNPLRCFQCQRFGHSKTVCRGQPTCSRCAEVGHDSADCKAKERCVNCKGDHSSFSRSCPTWLLEKEITALKIKNKISYPEARRVVSSRTPVSGKSYASAISKSYVSTAIQVDASTAPTSATAASITPKNVAVDTLKSVSPPRDKN
ncbi:uncharacterized protein TNCV_3323711 [Trichonephila clavipes]|nr:uncharacterized protein TNCV_3323711 [Trichonephila clavipes]